MSFEKCPKLPRSLDRQESVQTLFFLIETPNLKAAAGPSVCNHFLTNYIAACDVIFWVLVRYLIALQTCASSLKLKQQHSNHFRGLPMRSAHLRIAAILFASALPIAAQAPAAAPADTSSGIASITQTATRFENNIVSLAEAMPADKYDFAPSKDIFKAGSPAEFATVHTFAQQLTHICGMPYRMFAAFGVKPDTEVDPKSFDSLKSKDEIVKALKASFEYQNKVIASFTPENILTPVGPRNTTRASSLLLILADDGDHYGQMVEYGRMNGVIPPATANQMQRTPPSAPQK
jgi:uncharacterized damage-inducible protein DinB